MLGLSALDRVARCLAVLGLPYLKWEFPQFGPFSGVIIRRSVVYWGVF